MAVKIFDDFLSISDFKEAVSRIGSGPWYVHKSNEEDDSSFLANELDHDEFYTKHLFNQVTRLLVGNYELQRVYCNGQSHGREGQLHVDGCDVTALLYLHEYRYGWGGFTEVFTEPPSIVQPITNRLIIFPGMVKHKGYSFSYQNCPMRLSLAFKLNRKPLNN